MAALPVDFAKRQVLGSEFVERPSGLPNGKETLQLSFGYSRTSSGFFITLKLMQSSDAMSRNHTAQLASD